MMNFSSYHFCRTSCLKRMSMNKQMIESQQTSVRVATSISEVLVAVGNILVHRSGAKS